LISTINIATFVEFAILIIV